MAQDNFKKWFLSLLGGMLLLGSAHLLAAVWWAGDTSRQLKQLTETVVELKGKIDRISSLDLYDYQIKDLQSRVSTLEKHP